MSKKNTEKTNSNTPTAEQFVVKKMQDDEIVSRALKALNETPEEQVHFARLMGFIERRVRNTTKEGDEIALVPSYILKDAIYKAARAARAYKSAKGDQAKKKAETEATYRLIWAVLTREAIKQTVNYDPFTENRNVKEGAFGLQEVKDGNSNIPEELRKNIIWSGNKGKGRKTYTA